LIVDVLQIVIYLILIAAAHSLWRFTSFAVLHAAHPAICVLSFDDLYKGNVHYY